MLSLHNVLVVYFAINSFLAGSQLSTGIKRKRLKTSLALVFIFNLMFALPFNIGLFCYGFYCGFMEEWRRK